MIQNQGDEDCNNFTFTFMSDNDNNNDDDESTSSSVNFDSMTDAQLLEYHEEERDNYNKSWLHACPMYNPTESYAYIITSERRNRISRLFFTTEQWEEMADDISSFTTLKYINLEDCGLTDDKIEALFGGDYTYKCPVESLILSRNRFGSTGIAAMLPFLTERTFKHMILDSTNVCNEGVRLLSAISIEVLSLENCNFVGDIGVEHLLSSRNSAMLVELDLTGINFGRRGFESIARFLGRGGTAIKKFFANCNQNQGECAKMIVSALSSNNASKLEFISLHEHGGTREQRPSTRRDPILAVHEEVGKLLCDTTSFETICQSNHHLEWHEGHVLLLLNSNICRFETRSILGMNERRREHGATTVQILRSKLRSFYFTGEFDLQPFYDIDVNLMPYLLQLVTRKNESLEYKATNGGDLDRGGYYEVCVGDLASIYRIIRNVHMPELFEYPRLVEMKESEVAAMKQKIQQLTMELEELRCGHNPKRVKTEK